MVEACGRAMCLSNRAIFILFLFSFVRLPLSEPGLRSSPLKNAASVPMSFNRARARPRSRTPDRLCFFAAMSPLRFQLACLTKCTRCFVSGGKHRLDRKTAIEIHRKLGQKLGLSRQISGCDVPGETTLEAPVRTEPHPTRASPYLAHFDS
jgi:hypothetical protein